MTDWTPKKITILKNLWLAGLTGKEIGDKLGFTRCAIIAKKTRLGLAPRPVIAAEKPEVQAQFVRKSKYSNIPLSGDSIFHPRKPSLIELRPYECKFVIGDPKGEHFYCGMFKTRKNYCDKHHQLCYRKE